MTDNVLQMPTPLSKLAERLREDVAYTNQGREQWVEGLLRQARDLREARERFDSNNAFGVWLAQEEINIGPNDRAALIAMSEEPETLRAVLIEQTDVLHPDTIWRKYKDRFGKLPITDLQPPEIEKSQETTSESPATMQSPDPERPLKPAPPQTALRQVPRLNGWPRAEEVLAIYHNPKTRSALGRIPALPSGKQIWKLILQAIDTGLVQGVVTIDIKNVTARLLFPYGGLRVGHFLHEHDLTKAKDRNYVATDLLPRMIANKDALLAEPDNIEEILVRAERIRRATEQTAVVKQRESKALAALPSEETEVIMFGKRMWPLVLGETVGTYDFRTLQVAIWKFTDLNRWLMLGDKSAHGRAIMIRNSTKWDRHFIGEMTKGTEVAARIDRIYSLVHALCSLMEQNPDGECREPMTPLVLG